MARHSESVSDTDRPDDDVQSDTDGETSTTAGAAGAGPLMLDLEFVQGLIDAVDGSGIDSLEITRAGTRVKISKTPPAGAPAPVYYGAGVPAAPAPAPTAQPPAPAPATPAAPSAPEQQARPESGGDAAADAGSPADERDGLTEVPSPMVGTFYRAPAPDAPPYVEVGTKVRKGQTLCILEAMKLMNELESEVDGVVKEILVENADPVEYGQALFLIDPNG